MSTKKWAFCGGLDEMKADEIKKHLSDREMENKSDVLKFMKSFKPAACGSGRVEDKFKERHAGSYNTDVYHNIYQSDEFVWTAEMIYYFENYNLRLEQEFLDYVMDKISE